MAVLIRDSRITEVSFGWALLLPQTSRSSPWSLSVCLLRNYLLGLYLLALASRSVYRMQVPGYQSRAQWLGPSMQGWEGVCVGRVATQSPSPTSSPLCTCQLSCPCSP